MKGAIMQPYLFPYLGYFQLINAVEIFGIADDSQFINRGWINRNRILTRKAPTMFTFSIKKASHNKTIIDRYFHDNFDYEKKKFLKTLELNYKTAPYYNYTIKIVKDILDFKENNISKFIQNQLVVICNYLNIETSFFDSSVWKLEDESDMDLEERVIKKIKKTDITHFINPIGGTELYSKELFEKNDIDLNFLKSEEIVYQQFGNEFVPKLSIIDVMMFNSVDEIRLMLNKYKLV